MSNKDTFLSDNNTDNDNGGKTVIDTGWRSRMQAAADESSDNTADAEDILSIINNINIPQSESADSSHTNTVVDMGWRHSGEASGKDENKTAEDDDILSIINNINISQSESADSSHTNTVVDMGWRHSVEESGAGSNKTAAENEAVFNIEESFYNEADDRNKTVADKWDDKILRAATSANNSNAFRNIEDFKTAVAKLPELITLKGNKYKVLRTLNSSGGEALILLCENSEKRNVAAKVYYESVDGPGSSISARRKVFDYMATEDGKKYTLPIEDLDFITIDNSIYYIEIMPYCSEGDLSKQKAMSFSEIVEVTRFLNNALHSMHEYGLLHRDIKPSNIYKLDGRYVLGDFGVAKVASQGVAETTRFHVGTDGYCAPETLIALSDNPTFKYDTRCDYYSMGPTLASLFEGHFIYDNMNNEEIMSCIQNDRLPLSRQDPHRDQLENLLSGLCSFSANTRFDYRDVERWLADHNYKGGAGNAKWPKKFIMLGEEYNDDESFFYGITKDKAHWEEGKDLLFGKFFEQFFKSFRTDLARSAQLIEEEWRVKKDMDKGLSLFLKTLYRSGPIVWKGYTYKSIEELAERMLVTKRPTSYAELLQRNCISDWMENTSGIDISIDSVELVKNIERCSQSKPETACYWFGNAFAAEKKANVCGKEVYDMNGLVGQLFKSPRAFYLDGGLDHLSNFITGASMYGYFYSLGYEKIINETWVRISGSNKILKVCELMSMIDIIAMRENTDTSLIRSFFVKYGPFGAAEYTRQLVVNKGTSVYAANDKDGGKLLEAIAAFNPVYDKSVKDLAETYSSLAVSVEKMREKLEDNPFSLMSGAYVKKSITCRSMEGVFAFNFLESKAPLGFCSVLENSDGGSK